MMQRRSFGFFLFVGIALSFAPVIMAQDTESSAESNYQTQYQTNTQAQSNATSQSGTTSQQNATSIVQEAQRQGISEEQLKLMGIDPNDPVQAAKRARQLGASDSDIKRALEKTDQSSQTNTTDTFGTVDELSSIWQLADTTEESSKNPKKMRPGGELDGDDAEFSPDSLDFRQKNFLKLLEDDTFFGKGRFSGLRYYGYDIFRSGKKSASPIEAGPVDPGYPIGAGDVLRVTLWGEVEFQNELTVSRDGNIIMPRVGQIFVAGTRLDRLRETLKNYLSRYYSGLAQNPPSIFMDVTLARLRSGQVYIMGEVERPGSYSISSYATAFNAMYAIGGPKISGSLREVRILREGKIVSKVDLYDYLLKGTSPNDQRLQMGDIVFVPPRALSVGINGEVLRPGIYELTAAESFADLIKLAGGLNPTAYAFRAQIDRILPIERRVKGQGEHELIDVNIDDVVSKKQVIKLVDGDVVQIFPIVDKLSNYVDIAGGGIARPGRYELNGRIRTISDLISAADGLTADAYTLRAHLVRMQKNLKTKFIEVDLADAMRGEPGSNLELNPLDSLRVYSRIEMTVASQVTLSGYVKSPAKYPFHENMTLYGLLFASSGLQDSIRSARTFMDRADIFRLNADGKTRHVIPFNLKDVWEGKDGADIVLEPEDEVALYSKEVREYVTRTVWVSGSVKHPGKFEWKDNLTLADALLKVGGFAPGAWLLDAEVVRIPQTGISGDTLSYSRKVPILSEKKMPDDPETAIQDILSDKSPARAFLLEPGDHIFVRDNPDYAPVQIVTLVGEVKYPGEYSIRKRNETVRDVITRAGGIKSSAYVSAARLMRGKKQLYMDFEKLLVRKEKKSDVILMPGDRIIIPKKPNAVMVNGEVVNPGYFQFRSGLSVVDYLKMSGGRTQNGDKVYVTDPSGYTDQLRFLHNPKVQDGSVIQVLVKEVKEKEERTNWAEVVKETTAIVSSVMMVVYLSKQVNE